MQTVCHKTSRVKALAAQINVWLPALLAFFLPLSTSAISVLAICIALLWLCEGNFWQKIDEITSNPVVVSVLVFLCILAVGLCWSPDVGAGLEVLQKRWKIILVPVFFTTVRRENRSLYVWAFLAGLTVAMSATFLAWFDLLHYADVTPQHLTKKTFHVVYNPLLAFGIYLLFHEILWGRYSRVKQVVLSLLAAVMTFNMFITEGRTGQLVFFVLLGLLILQICKTNRLKAVCLTVALLPALFLTGYTTSPVFKQRVNTAWLEICQFEMNPDTSVGLRLLFWQNSWEIIRQHPVLGVGTGGFEQAYARINQQHHSSCVATDNPHNQYVLVATTVGVPGILALVMIFLVMFRQSVIMGGRWRQARVAFPLFFLIIMLTESYLKITETGLFFALFAAVFYRQAPDKRLASLVASKEKCWLILSYRANIAGSACSQHIDDRLPFFRKQGIEPVLLTGPVGKPSPTWIHLRTHSVAPSGIRFEVRHYLRRHLQKRWQFKLVETLVLLPVFPLYLLEKIIINLESEWSWWVMASIRGVFLCNRLQPAVIYSTGGSASAHVAALIIKHFTGIQWMAETQDPLVHDQDWQRSTLVLKIYRLLERYICARADRFVFLVKAALQHTEQRVQGMCRGSVVYPGSIPSLFKEGLYKKGTLCHFAHFGSLAGTRNLVVFFQALARAIEENRSLTEVVRVDVYGSFDDASRREMQRLHLDDLVICHGTVSRKQALLAMQKADCLLLVQNILYFSCETIPSKVYEYILSGRPIIGLLYNNEELQSMLRTNGHLTVQADDRDALAATILELVAAFESTEFHSKKPARVWTTEQAVRDLVSLVDQ